MVFVKGQKYNKKTIKKELDTVEKLEINDVEEISDINDQQEEIVEKLEFPKKFINNVNPELLFGINQRFGGGECIINNNEELSLLTNTVDFQLGRIKEVL